LAGAIRAPDTLGVGAPRPFGIQFRRKKGQRKIADPWILGGAKRDRTADLL